MFGSIRCSILYCLSLCSVAFGRHNHDYSFLDTLSRSEVKSSISTDFMDISDDLVAFPTTFMDGEDIKIEWNHMKNPENKDFLGISCGRQTSGDDFLDKVTVTNTTGSGSYVFSGLINMRCNYTIGYYEQSDNVATQRAIVSISPRNGIDEPMHIHTAFANKPSERTIMWTSASKDTPRLRLWRYNNPQYQEYNTTQREKYEPMNFCGPPANTTTQIYYRDPGYQNKVVLTNLLPGLYTYSISNNQIDWTDKQFLLIDTVRQQTSKLVAYGDLGINAPTGAQETIGRILQLGLVDYVLHFGDISYARGKGWIWEKFFHMIEPVAKHIPYMVSIGNHEYDHTGQPHKDPSGVLTTGFNPSWGNYGDDSSGECSVPMYNRFTMPSNGNSLYWYSFNSGLTHVIQFSTEHDYTYLSDQYKWIEQDLKQVNRSETPYIIVTGHRPMYTSEQPYADDFKISVNMQEALEDLFYTYGVDLALWGHYHSYERTCPVYKRKCDKDGITHIVVGTAGAAIEGGKFGGKGFEWSVANALVWGFLYIEADDQQMHVQFIKNSDGMIGDEVYIQNRQSVSFF